MTSRVEKGAAFLDEIRPGWEFEIDLRKLELSNSCRCVLGQLYVDEAERSSSGFAWATGGNIMSVTDAVVMGFFLEGNDIDYRNRANNPTDAAYSELDEIWIEKIKEKVNRA